MNKLEIYFEPSEESNDHQARILIDGEDYLKNQYLGFDPPEFFEQTALLDGGTALIGRCNCGVPGCCDLIAEIAVENQLVHWLVEGKYRLSFDSREYIKCIKDAAQYFAWESIERTAERLVNKVFTGTKLNSGHTFRWSSGRIEPGKIKLSFMKEGNQLLHSIDWDGINPTSAVNAAKEAYKQLILNG